MSVDLLISKPVNAAERNVMLPICTEEVHQTVLLPIALAHDLPLIEDWGTFVHIDASNLDEFIRQLNIAKAEIFKAEHLSMVAKYSFESRLDEVIAESTALIHSRPGLVVSIG